MSAARTARTSFGELVSNALADRQMTQVDIARALNVSPSYANQTLTGTKPASPRWADLVADVLKMSAEQRASLHAAAAKDAGYKLDLMPPEKNKS